MASVMTPSPTSRVAISATKLLINNRWVDSESGKTFATINPSTGEEICQIAEADAADVEQSCQSRPHRLRARPLAQDAGLRARHACSTAWPI